MTKDINEIDEQAETDRILKVMKGVFLYASKNKQVLHNEKILFELIVQSCNNIIRINSEKEFSK